MLLSMQGRLLEPTRRLSPRDLGQPHSLATIVHIVLEILPLDDVL